MDKKSKKKNVQWQQWLVMVFFVAIGVVCGIFMIDYMEQRANAGISGMG